MITDEQIDRMTSEERKAWHAGMTDDEWLVCCIPPGVRYDLVIAAQIKGVLLARGGTLDDRMKMLQGLNGIIGNFITEEALAVIEPACATARQMFSELMALSINNRCRVFWRQEPFNSFLALNPSLLAAIKLCPSLRPYERTKVA